MDKQFSIVMGKTPLDDVIETLRLIQRQIEKDHPALALAVQAFLHEFEETQIPKMPEPTMLALGLFLLAGCASWLEKGCESVVGGGEDAVN